MMDDFDKEFRNTRLAPKEQEPHDEGHPHLIDGEFQSDKYPTCPRGKVPLSCKDPTAQDLLWEYAQRRRSVDAEFAADLEDALRSKGYDAGMAYQRERAPDTKPVATREMVERTRDHLARRWEHALEQPLTGPKGARP